MKYKKNNIWIQGVPILLQFEIYHEAYCVVSFDPFNA